MRSILRIFSRFAVVFAALTLTAMPAQAQSIGDIFDIEIGARSGHSHHYRSPRVGSDDWAERRFVFNTRSVIRTHLLPSVAEYGEEGVWQAGVLNIPGVRTVQNGRSTSWATMVGRYDVNVNLRVRDRQQTARRNVVRISVRMDMYGPGLDVDGERASFTLIGVQTRDGFWSIYPNNAETRRRFLF